MFGGEPEPEREPREAGSRSRRGPELELGPELGPPLVDSQTHSGSHSRSRSRSRLSQLYRYNTSKVWCFASAA